MNRKFFLKLKILSFVLIFIFGLENVRATDSEEQNLNEIKEKIKNLEQEKRELKEQFMNLEIEKRNKYVSIIANQKVSQSITPGEYDRLVNRAIDKVEDQETRDTLNKLWHANANKKEFEIILNWLIFHVPNPQVIFLSWKNLPLEKKPMVIIPRCFSESIRLENLEGYLTYVWEGESFSIGGEKHCVAIDIQKDEEQKKVTVSYYDAYEGLMAGNKLEDHIRDIITKGIFKNDKVEWETYYTNHQKLTAFGECELYACVYKNFLSQKLKPNTLSEEKIIQKVEEKKMEIRNLLPFYFQEYDNVFQYIFDTGFAQILLDEIVEYRKPLEEYNLWG